MENQIPNPASFQNRALNMTDTQREKKSGQRQIQLTQQVSFPVTWICQFLHLNSTSLHQKSLSQRHQGRDDGLLPCFTFSIDDIEMISSRDFHLSAELDAQCKWLWLTIEDKKLQGALKNLRCWINLGSQIVIFSFKKKKQTVLIELFFKDVLKVNRNKATSQTRHKRGHLPSLGNRKWNPPVPPWSNMKVAQHEFNKDHNWYN